MGGEEDGGAADRGPNATRPDAVRRAEVFAPVLHRKHHPKCIP